MKCKKGFKEKNGKCVKERKTYCDTNILTAFVNRIDLKDRFGKEYSKEYPEIKGFRSPNAGNKLKKIDKCIIDKESLFSDLHKKNAPMGAVLTSVNLKDIDILDIGGEEVGRKIFNRTCSMVERNSRFYKNFCKEGKLKNKLNRSNLNDVRHFGSAIKSKCTIFLTDNLRDFRPLKKVTKMEVE